MARFDFRDVPTLPQPLAPGRPSPGDSPGDELVAGTRLGRYVILQTLGSGGTGRVYAAYDSELDRSVALKLLPEAEPEARHRLLREARTAARLRHPNVVTVYDAGVLDGRPYLVMERVQGKPLGHWLQEDSPALGEILDVFRQAGEGLLAAHRGGLVHQDFKLGNVVVDDGGRAVVVDFGLARPTRIRSEAHPEASWPVGGTPPYASPEQMAGEPADARSDQYAFCVALTAALRGGPRPEGVPEPSPEAPAMPEHLRHAVERGLSRGPEERHPSLQPVLDALEPAWPRLPRWLRPRYVVAAVVVLGLALGSLAALRITRGTVSTLEARFDSTWNPQRIRQIRRAFAATDHSQADALFDSSRVRLDEYAESWSRELRAAVREGAAPSSPRILCLDALQVRFDALLELLTTLEHRTVESTPRILLDLEDPAACRRHPEGFLRPRVPASRPDLVVPVRDLRRRLAFVEAAELTQTYEQVLPLVRQSVEEAAATGWPPIFAEALFWQGRTERMLRRCDDARGTLHRAVRESFRADHLQMAAHSLALLTSCAQVRGDLAEARSWSRLTERVLADLPPHNEAASSHHFFLARLALTEGRTHEAIEHYEASLATDPASTPKEQGDVYNDVSTVLMQQDRYDEARTYLHRALDAYQAFYHGRSHMMVPPLANLATLERLQGNFEMALLFYQRAWEILRRSENADVRYPVYVLTGLGITQVELGRPEEALDPLEEAIRRCADCSDGAFRGRSRFALARALWALDRDRPGALELAREALRELERAGPSRREEAQEVRTWIETRIL